jgi:hypothetical protein
VENSIAIASTFEQVMHRMKFAISSATLRFGESKTAASAMRYFFLIIVRGAAFLLSTRSGN